MNPRRARLLRTAARCSASSLRYLPNTLADYLPVRLAACEGRCGRRGPRTQRAVREGNRQGCWEGSARKMQNIEQQYVIDALAEDSWRMFRIIGEFVQGFEDLAGVGKAVTIFGSARTDEGSEDYQSAHDLAKQLAEAGFAILTGGGPGIMQAANQ